MADYTQLATTKTPYDTTVRNPPTGVFTPTPGQPSVQTSDSGRTAVGNALVTQQTKDLGQQTQSINNQTLAAQTAQDKIVQDQKIQADKQAESDKQAKIQETQAKLKSTQDLVTAAQGLGYTDQNLQFTSGKENTAAGLLPPPPSNTGVPAGVNISNTEGQADWYNKNPDQFNQWATDNKMSEADISNVKYQASIQNFNQEADAAKADLAKFQNGTYPLTPDQQSLLDATKAQFEGLITQQQQTNKSYENGVRILGQVTGRAEYFPDIAMSEVHTAVSNGLSKVADLQSQESSALAKLREGFRTDNFKMVHDAHQMVLDIDKQIEQQMKDTHDSIVKAQVDARDFNYKITQDNIKNTLDSDKFTWQQKVDQVDAQLKQSGLDEDKRHNLATEAAAKVSSGLINNINLPQVSMTSSGIPNQAQQDAFLAQFPQDLATTIKQIADYKQNPSSIPTRNYKGVGGVTQSQVLSWVAQYDPTYNQAQYATRQSLLTNFASGKYAQNITSLNTAIGHIDTLVDNFGNLNNTSFTPYNHAINSWKEALGVGQIKSAQSNINAVVDELATAFKGSGATDQEIDTWKKTLSIDASPDQQKAFIETGVNLLNSRLESLNSTYEMGMGKPKEGGFLSDKNQQGLLKLKNNGYDIKVSDLTNSPYVKLQAFHDSDANNAKILDQIKSIAPNASAQEVIDALAQNGITL